MGDNGALAEYHHQKHRFGKGVLGFGKCFFFMKHCFDKYS
jgi:hypothetical protein